MDGTPPYARIAAELHDIKMCALDGFLQTLKTIDIASFDCEVDHRASPMPSGQYNHRATDGAKTVRTPQMRPSAPRLKRRRAPHPLIQIKL